MSEPLPAVRVRRGAEGVARFAEGPQGGGCGVADVEAAAVRGEAPDIPCRLWIWGGDNRWAWAGRVRGLCTRQLL